MEGFRVKEDKDADTMRLKNNDYHLDGDTINVIHDRDSAKPVFISNNNSDDLKPNFKATYKENNINNDEPRLVINNSKNNKNKTVPMDDIDLLMTPKAQKTYRYSSDSDNGGKNSNHGGGGNHSDYEEEKARKNQNNPFANAPTVFDESNDSDNNSSYHSRKNYRNRRRDSYDEKESSHHYSQSRSRSPSPSHSPPPPQFFSKNNDDDDESDHKDDDEDYGKARINMTDGIESEDGSEYSHKDDDDDRKSYKDEDDDYSSVDSNYKLTDEQKLMKKHKFINDIEKYMKKGYQPIRRMTIEDQYEIIKCERDRLADLHDRDKAVKRGRDFLITAASGIEFLNSKYNPFDVKLNGWSESIQSDIGDYDEVFEELHEKYKGKGNMPPELRLLFMVGGSAVKFHLTNKIFNDYAPNMDDILKNDPNLRENLERATMNHMKQNAGDDPAFNMMQNDYENYQRFKTQGRGGGGGPNQNMPSNVSVGTREGAGAAFRGPKGVDDILENIAAQSTYTANTNRDTDSVRGGMPGNRRRRRGNNISVNL